MRNPLSASLAFLLLGACQGDSTGLLTHELAGQSMSTTFSIKIVSADPELNYDAIGERLSEAIAQVDSRMSTWKPDSDLSQLNARQSSGWIYTSDELCRGIAAALAISESTGGAFDITIGPLVNLWGFGPDRTKTEPPTNAEILLALKEIGYQRLDTDCNQNRVRKRRPGIYIDLSGYAKGLAVDRLAQTLDELGVHDYLVELGGEIRVSGHNSKIDNWRIAIENPGDQERIAHSAIRITDLSVATSGDYRNYFEHAGKRYSHTIDPRTGRPVEHATTSVTVIGKSAATADAIATALLVLGHEAGLNYANERKIAALFIVRGESGPVSFVSKEFMMYMER